jgi:hypothetical protein
MMNKIDKYIEKLVNHFINIMIKKEKEKKLIPNNYKYDEKWYEEYIEDPYCSFITMNFFFKRLKKKEIFHEFKELPGDLYTFSGILTEKWSKNSHKMINRCEAFKIWIFLKNKYNQKHANKIIEDLRKKILIPLPSLKNIKIKKKKSLNFNPNYQNLHDYILQRIINLYLYQNVKQLKFDDYHLDLNDETNNNNLYTIKINQKLMDLVFVYLEQFVFNKKFL